MKITYEVAYTIDGSREFEAFTNKRKALAFAKEITRKGATKVFVDWYEGTEGDELADYRGSLALSH